jgi:transcriptional regulator with XRE-family HTH domain
MKPVDRKAFGERVARRREKLGMSQPELAREVGMKQQGIDHIEHGVVSRPRLLRELAVKLNTTEQWLLWNEGPETVVSSTFNVISVPLIAWESAADVEPHLDGVPHLAISDLGRGTFFGLRVENDSMNRISPPGSIIIVNRDDRELVKDRFAVGPHKNRHRNSARGSDFKGEAMTCAIRPADSDSVNLGSNPSPPAMKIPILEQ